MICWEWCTLKHEHVFGPASGGAAHTPHLSPEERKRIATQLGVDVVDKDDMRKAAEAKGFRVMERGERGDVQRRELKEWREGEPLPPSWRPPRVRNPLDIHRIYRESESR